MAMEINERYDYYKTTYSELMKAEQEKAKEAEKEQKGEKVSIPQDEYISSEKSGDKPSGLYRVGQDENGNRKLFYDDPKKSNNADGSKQPKVKADDPKKPAEKCTGNTDQVDREIKKLKEKKKELEQQIRAASGDEKKVRELEKKLAQVESELSQKDNDTYRRQHSTFTDKN